jgi:hypothetical protein
MNTRTERLKLDLSAGFDVVDGILGDGSTAGDMTTAVVRFGKESRMFLE